MLRLPSGASVWAACDVSVSSLAFSSYISWMIVIWSLCLVLTLLVVTVLVRRIVRPLRQLSELTATVTADTLQNSHVQFSAAPKRSAAWPITMRICCSVCRSPGAISASL